MYLERLVRNNFGNYKNLCLVVDKSGVFVFCGKNGSGKSMIVEAIVWALYGCYVRARQKWIPRPIRNGTSVSVAFRDPDLRLTRSFDNGKASIVLDEPRIVSVRDSNEHICGLFGPFKVATSSSIFHCKYLNRFSVGGDSERKTIIEELLGVDTLDVVNDRVSIRLRNAESARESLDGQCRDIVAHINWFEGSYSTLKEPEKAIFFGDADDIERIAFGPSPKRPKPVEDTELRSECLRREVLCSAHKSLCDDLDIIDKALNDKVCPFCGQSVLDVNLSRRKDLCSELEKIEHRIKNLESSEVSLEKVYADKKARYHRDLIAYESDITKIAEAREKLRVIKMIKLG